MVPHSAAQLAVMLLSETTELLESGIQIPLQGRTIADEIVRYADPPYFIFQL
jgi:hypothetical protein